MSIKKSHRGRFLAYSKRLGYTKVTNAAIAQGKKSSSKRIRAMAVFAENARKSAKKRSK